MKNLKKTAAWVLLAAGLNLVGCMEQGNSVATAPTGDNPAIMSVRVGLDPVNALAKTSTISLKKLIMVLTSSANDTIRDTITSSTTPAISATATTAQTVAKSYSLKPLRIWKLVATTKDLKDSVIHRDSVTSPELYAADTANVSLSLSSHFSMYAAQFNIPDSISSSASGTLKQVLHLNRLVLIVDGVTEADSTVNPGPYYAPLAISTISYDYVTVGSHTVQLLAYGPMAYWNTANPLYSGSTTINVGTGNDSTVAMTLNWVGPTTGTSKMSVTIGKVGKITVNGTLPGTVIQ